ncbi:MAG: hypothetical protein AABN95_10645 [Acidobacteriota bacterium]
MTLRFVTAFCLVMMVITLVAAQSPAIPTSTPATVDPCAETNARLTRLENRLKDWPDLGRYHDANTKFAPPDKNEQRVVFMGDSITDS